jgi:7,8-dihydro-6-hydroxymethylpterin dimethyltransferase
MKEIIGQTESLCPVCLAKIPAQRVIEGDNVYLEKSCPDHGHYQTLIWRGARSYQRWSGYGEPAAPPSQFQSEERTGCPFDCGLCPEHTSESCTVVVEVTHRCNLNCAVCFASANQDDFPDPDMAGIERMFDAIIASRAHPSVQISGGEPTERDDLAAIVALGKQKGFRHIQVNTNGLRIAQDRAYLKKLVEAGTDLIYLQFDGVCDCAYSRIRSAQRLFELKHQAVQNCAEAGIGVMLVPTILRGVNLSMVGDIVRFAKKWVPIVKGVHFQPASYFGRFPQPPADDERTTLADVIDELVAQMDGEMKVDHFLPRSLADSHCSFSSVFALKEDGRLEGRTKVNWNTGDPSAVAALTPPEMTRQFIDKRWRYVDLQAGNGTCACKQGMDTWLGKRLWESQHSLTISGMPFQDAWNIDLQRLKGCCVHVVTLDGRFIPLCAFYLTSASGQRLYSQEKQTSLPMG